MVNVVRAEISIRVAVFVHDDRRILGDVIPRAVNGDVGAIGPNIIPDAIWGYVRPVFSDVIAHRNCAGIDAI